MLCKLDLKNLSFPFSKLAMPVSNLSLTIYCPFVPLFVYTELLPLFHWHIYCIVFMLITLNWKMKNSNWCSFTFTFPRCKMVYDILQWNCLIKYNLFLQLFSLTLQILWDSYQKWKSPQFFSYWQLYIIALSFTTSKQVKCCQYFLKL